MQIIIKQPSTSTKRSSYDSGAIENGSLRIFLFKNRNLLMKDSFLDISKRRSWLSIGRDSGSGSKEGSKSNSVVTGPTAANRRGRFIVLGSSGECLPVNRKSQPATVSNPAAPLQHCDSNSIYSSCDSDDSEDEEYHSARASFEDCIEGEPDTFDSNAIIFSSQICTIQVLYYNSR